MIGMKDMALLPMFVSVLVAVVVFFGAGAFSQFLDMGFGEFAALSTFLKLLGYASLLLPVMAFVALSTTVKGSKQRGRAVVFSIGMSALFAILLTGSVAASIWLGSRMMAEQGATASVGRNAQADLIG